VYSGLGMSGGGGGEASFHDIILGIKIDGTGKGKLPDTFN
jgi:hypothetical protein